jgi:hypothetical protein
MSAFRMPAPGRREPPWTTSHDARPVSGMQGLLSAKNIVATLPAPGSSHASTVAAVWQSRAAGTQVTIPLVVSA